MSDSRGARSTQTSGRPGRPPHPLQVRRRRRARITYPTLAAESWLMTEHREAVLLYIALSGGDDTGYHNNDNGEPDGNGDEERASGAGDLPPSGTAMTAGGPAPFAGRILDNPDILWMDDHWTREEEEEAQRLVEEKGPPVSEFWREKYEREARKSWDLFYKRNADNFFKDRHYLGKVFPEVAETQHDRDLAHVRTCIRLVERIEASQALRVKPAEIRQESGQGTIVPARGRLGRRTLLELGCGVGNAVFPLLEENQGLYVIALDLSPRGIEVLKRHPMYNCGRCEAAVLDATTDELPLSVLEDGGVDLVLLQFSLSAVAPKDMAAVARLAGKALKPGGKLLIRDYGRHDEAQLRFAKGRRLGDNLYVRQDGTTSYFFSMEDLRHLFCGASTTTPAQQADFAAGSTNPDFGSGASLVEEELSFVRRQYANRGQRVARRRVWVHGKFLKPS